MLSEGADVVLSVSILSALLGLSAISRWIESRCVDAEVGCFLERKRRVQWGRHGGHWYFWIELPSWEWELDYLRRVYCWHQRVIFWDDDWGWKLTLVPESQRVQ